MRKRVPSHGTVVAYLALFAALGGSAYAINKVDSADVANNSLRSKDLRNDKAVRGIDVVEDSLTGADIRESRLEARQFVTLGRAGGGCVFNGSAFVACAQVTVDVPTRSRALAIGTGVYAGATGEPAPAGTCRITSGGGVASAVGLDGAGIDAFTVTGLVDLPPGRHGVAMECQQLIGTVTIEEPTITVFGIGEFD